MNAGQSTVREDGRSFLELRPLSIAADINPHADGSAEVFLGATRLILNARLFRDSGAARRIDVAIEMLPCATYIRERTQAVIQAEASELEVVRSLAEDALEASIAQASLNDLCVQLYCSVVCSDGGVAGACIAGGWVALYQALRSAANQELIDEDLEVTRMVGLSGGMVDGRPMLDLATGESGLASFRTVLVFNSHKQLVKMQGAQEQSAADVLQLQQLLTSASEAIDPILAEQERAALELG